MRKGKVLTLLFVLGFVVQTQASTIVYQDDFNRANNDVLGGSWEEDSGNGARTRIQSNVLKIERGPVGYMELANWARIGGLEDWLDFDITYKFRVLSDEYQTRNTWIKFCAGVETIGWSSSNGWDYRPNNPGTYEDHVGLEQWVGGVQTQKNISCFPLDAWADITISVRGNEATITSVYGTETRVYSLPAGALDRNPENTQYFVILPLHQANLKYDAEMDDFMIEGITPIPEPTTICLLAVGIIGIWRKKR